MLRTKRARAVVGIGGLTIGAGVALGTFVAAGQGVKAWWNAVWHLTVAVGMAGAMVLLMFGVATWVSRGEES